MFFYKHCTLGTLHKASLLAVGRLIAVVAVAVASLLSTPDIFRYRMVIIEYFRVTNQYISTKYNYNYNLALTMSDGQREVVLADHDNIPTAYIDSTNPYVLHSAPFEIVKLVSIRNKHSLGAMWLT